MTKPSGEFAKLAKALLSWQDALLHLGECVVEFQRLEEYLAICISALNGRDKTVGEILSTEMSFRVRVNVFGALFLHRLGQQELPEDVKWIIQRLYWAEEQRNLLVHSIWDAVEPETDSVESEPDSVRRTKKTVRKHILRKSDELWVTTQLEDLHEAFEGIATDLFSFTSEYFPKLRL